MYEYEANELHQITNCKEVLAVMSNHNFEKIPGKFTVLEYDFAMRCPIKKVKGKLDLAEAKELAKTRALCWAEDEGIRVWEAHAEGEDIVCVCSPYSDYGCIVVPSFKRIKEAA